MAGEGSGGIRPTRVELLRVKKREMLARKGHDLLEEKLDAMLLEQMRVEKNLEILSADIRETAASAYFSLFHAIRGSGYRLIEEISWTAPEIPDIMMETRQVMGIHVPSVSSLDLGRGDLPGYSYSGVSGQIDDATVRFRVMLSLLVRVAEAQGILRLLTQEIASTRRRVNALEHIIIPRLQKTGRYIEMHLEEREREDLFRRKRSKQLLSRRKSGGMPDQTDI
jgi:V/A-type H+-transporting ATPase subunit D